MTGSESAGQYDVDTFVGSYEPDTPVKIGDGAPMTLGQALQFEALFCTADEARRTDPTARLPYLAKMLAATGSLRPEHIELLPED